MSATGCTCPIPFSAGPFEHLPTCPTRAVIGPVSATTVRLDDHKPLASVGLVCTCGKALASMELAARACACGRVWLISVSQIGGPE